MLKWNFNRIKFRIFMKLVIFAKQKADAKIIYLPLTREIQFTCDGLNLNWIFKKQGLQRFQVTEFVTKIMRRLQRSPWKVYNYPKIFTNDKQFIIINFGTYIDSHNFVTAENKTWKYFNVLKLHGPWIINCNVKFFIFKTRSKTYLLRLIWNVVLKILRRW